jgi:hypothetical protein
MSIVSSLVETIEKGFGQIGANLNKSTTLVHATLVEHDEVIPNNMFNISFVPLFLV